MAAARRCLKVQGVKCAGPSCSCITMRRECGGCVAVRGSVASSSDYEVPAMAKTITTLSGRQFSRDTGRPKRSASKGPAFNTDRRRPVHKLLTFEDYRARSRVAQIPRRPWLICLPCPGLKTSNLMHRACAQLQKMQIRRNGTARWRGRDAVTNLLSLWGARNWRRGPLK